MEVVPCHWFKWETWTGGQCCVHGLLVQELALRVMQVCEVKILQMSYNGNTVLTFITSFNPLQTGLIPVWALRHILFPVSL